MIMIQGYCSWNFYELLKCLRFLKVCLKAILQVPISLTRTFRKTTHTQTHTDTTYKHTSDCFSLKNHGQSFFLNHWFLQFNCGINREFYFCAYSLSEEIREILLCKNEFCKNIYLPKYISVKIIALR